MFCFLLAGISLVVFLHIYNFILYNVKCCCFKYEYFRFSSLDKQDKGYLSREDFLRIPELAINPLGDRIVHAFFFESRSQEEEKVDFKDFVRVLAHFRPIKKNAEKNKLNTRMEKLHFAFRLDLDS